MSISSISYIVATCNKKRLNNLHLSEDVLKLQMNEFFQLLENKKVNNVPHLFKEVIFIYPTIHDKNNDAFEHYYDFEVWKNKLNEYDIKMCIVKTDIPNHKHSYDQWLIGCNVSTGDYNMLIEDDYCLDKNNLTLEQDLIKCYNDIFVYNVGYLTTYADKNHVNHGYHAAISNGLISRKTIKEYLKDVDLLSEFYKINEYSQVAFSQLFLLQNVFIEDFRHLYRILFWDAGTKTMKDYTLNNVNRDERHVFIPLQHFY